MNVGELFIKLGFDVDAQKLKDFQGDLQQGLASMLKLSAAATGALWAFERLSSNLTDNALQLENFNILTGESTVELQKWQAAATLENPALSIDQVRTSILALNKTIADASMGQGQGGGLFSQLTGQAIYGKGAFEVLEELRNHYQDAVQRWGLRQTHDMISGLGIDPGMINALQLSREEFDKLADSRVLSPETLQALTDFRKEMNQLKFDFDQWMEIKAAEIFPDIKAAYHEMKPTLDGILEDFDHIFNLFQRLPGPAQAAGFATFMAVLAPQMTAFAVVVGTLAFALAELDKMLSGENTSIGNFTRWWGNGLGDIITPLFEKDMPNTMNQNMNFRDRYRLTHNGQEPPPINEPPPSGVDITDVHSEADLDRILGAARGNTNITNNIEIHSESDPQAIGDAVGRAVQPTYDRTGAQVNLGPRN